MKKIFIILILTSLTLPLYAEIVISSFEGLVEIQLPGSSSWEKPEMGATLPPESKISTGFHSKALLLINNASEVTVRALTRLKVEEVMGQNYTGNQHTKLFMNSGRIDADIKRNEGSIHDFQVRTPVSTAAVRGTRFSFSPGELSVEEGVVQYTVGNYRFSLNRGQSISLSMSNGQPALQAPLQSILNSKRVQTRADKESDTGENAFDDATENQSGETGYAAIHLR